MEASLGDWLVTGSSILVAGTAIFGAEITAKLIKATVMASQKEMSRVARNADDDMKDVAEAYAPKGGAGQ